MSLRTGIVLTTLHPLEHARASSWHSVSAFFDRLQTKARTARTKHVLVASLLLPAMDPRVSFLPSTHLAPTTLLRLYDRTRSRRLRSALRFEAKHVAPKTLVLCRFELPPRFFLHSLFGFLLSTSGTNRGFVPFERGFRWGLNPVVVGRDVLGTSRFECQGDRGRVRRGSSTGKAISRRHVRRRALLNCTGKNKAPQHPSSSLLDPTGWRSQ